MYQKIQITIHKLKILLLLAAAALASQALSSAQDYGFHRYGRKDGLPPTTIEDICRSGDGFVWLASWTGIFRFDGSEFVRFNPEGDTRSIRFTSIEADNSGTIWALGHDGSLYSIGQGSASMERHTPGRSYEKMFLISDGSVMFTASDGAVIQRENPAMPTRVLKKGTRINLHFGETVIPAILNDSETARALLARLPLTQRMTRYSHDFCGVMESPLPYREDEVHYGWLNGDIDFARDGNYFTILFEYEKNSWQYGHQINIGVLACELSRIASLRGSYDVRIERAE